MPPEHVTSQPYKSDSWNETPPVTNKKAYRKKPAEVGQEVATPASRKGARRGRASRRPQTCPGHAQVQHFSTSSEKKLLLVGQTRTPPRKSECWRSGGKATANKLPGGGGGEMVPRQVRTKPRPTQLAAEPRGQRGAISRPDRNFFPREAGRHTGVAPQEQRTEEPSVGRSVSVSKGLTRQSPAAPCPAWPPRSRGCGRPARCTGAPTISPGC